jgi:glycosyltransferase involved in cell wall biosynthesis
MKELLNMERAFVIPNGVDTERFRPISKIEAREKIGYPVGKRLIVFISSPNRPEKNIELAWKAIKSLKNKNIELLHVYDIPNEKIPFYLNAADALLLTSRWEGSANVVKEAMACNCPIVSTNVGDVKWVLGQTEGCYITKSDFTDIVEKINFALNFNNRTQGRNRLSEIDSKTIASKIIALYNTLNLHV